MDQITGLLQNDLAVLLAPILLGVRSVYVLFLVQDGLPILPKWVVPVTLLTLAQLLAFSNSRLSMESPAALAGLWWVQGLLFWIGLIASDALASLLYGKQKEAKLIAAGDLPPNGGTDA